MSESFQLGGDPAQIRASARLWSAFSQAASSAATGIRSLDTADFEGDEAETYRERITADLPKHLDTASTAWGVVATALSTYASELEGHQRAISALGVKAGNQQSTVNSHRTALECSQRSDRSHTLSLVQTRESLKPGEKMPHDTYVSCTASDQQNLNNAKAALQATYDAASKVRGENAESVRRCRAEIDRAKGMRFAKPPGFWGRLKDSVCGWIADHADVLSTISSVLKTISGIAGLLALIPVLAPVMGPIALATGGAALVIDVGVKLATGKGSWTQIGLDAVSMVPGARAARLAFTANTAYGGYQVATGKESLADFALNTGMGALAFKGGGSKFGGERGGPENMSGAKATGGESGGPPNADPPGTGGAGKNRYHEVIVDANRHPESAAHIVEAQAGTTWRGQTYRQGDPHPDVVTIDRDGAKGRRRAATGPVQAIKRKFGIDRDEYPPAVFAEGGKGSSVKYIRGGDNKGAGSSIGHQIKGLPDGTKVRIRVVNGPQPGTIRPPAAPPVAVP